MMQWVLAAVRRQWRWALVGTGFVALVALPAVVGALPVEQSDLPADALVDRIVDSGDQPYHGYAEARGGLRLPELSGAADLSTLISDTCRMRLWYESPELAGRPPLFGG